MKLNCLIILGAILSLIFACTRDPEPSTDAMSSSPNPVNTVNSSTDSSISSAQSVEKSGTFVAGEHPTQGTARVVTENGTNYLELDRAFKTFDMGPDLHVILHSSDDVIGSTKPPSYPLQEQDYVILGRLQKFSGAQRYPIANKISLADYKSAVIWCRKFNATFGAASLNS